jgi:hypothetical protein
MTTLTFHQALVQAEAQARSTLDVALHERLSCAVALVKDGAVFQANDHTWTVASASTPGKEYSPNGTCGCDDMHYNKPRYCKHQLAMFVAQRVSTLMRQPPQPVVPVEPWPDNDPEAPAAAPAAPAVPPALPEAPVSITLKATLHGHEVLVTLRGTDFASVQAQVEQAAQWLKSQAPASPPGQPSQGQHTEGWCAVHNVAMRWNDGKEGRKGWYSHRHEGQWCKGK